ncbi:MAG: phosphoribosyltransferase family protein [Candidatus Saccharimonadales bacterium]
MPKKLADILQGEGVVIHKSVELRSGEKSDHYIDIKKSYGNPKAIEAITDELAAKIDENTTCIAGMGHGGLPLAVAVSMKTGLPLAMVRDSERSHGLGGMIDGYIPGAEDKVSIVDDVFTTGSSLRATMVAIEEFGANVLGCYVVVKRGDGELSVPLTYLLESKDLIE